MDSHTFPAVILREYDIRGQIGKNLSEDDAYALGRAFATYIFGQSGSDNITICLGYDGRESSPRLSAALQDGMVQTGANVINVGRGPTPMLYFAFKHLNADAGIMVTGSHNPPDYNGFKMAMRAGPIFGEKIQEIGDISAKGQYRSGTGSAQNRDISADYIARLLQDLTSGVHMDGMKVAWDNGNGAAGDILRGLTAKMPGEHILLFDDIDGSFPNHHPDPTVDKNLTDLRDVVLREKCDLGIAFDGDGDRIGVVDNEGTILRCDILMTLYAGEILQERPGAAIIGDVKCSDVMFKDIAAKGGNAVMWKTGHSLIKDKMAELNAPLAGELSGHIFFADKYYGFDDALYCGVRLLNIIGESDKTLAQMTDGLANPHSTAEIRFDVDENEKFGLVPRIQDNLRKEFGDDLEINDIDGIRITTEDGWWLLRPSNTQAVLVARAESKSKEGLERLTSMASAAVKATGYDLAF